MFQQYQLLAATTGLPDLKDVPKENFDAVQALQDLVHCSPLHSIRKSLSKVEQRKCEYYWNAASETAALIHPVFALLEPNEAGPALEKAVEYLESKKLSQTPYYQKLAARCGLPIYSESYYAKKLDKIAFCATEFPKRSNANSAMRHYCGNWSYSNPNKMFNLNYHVNNYLENIITGLGHQETVDTKQKVLDTLQKMQNGEE
jgi:hypothetical protein